MNFQMFKLDLEKAEEPEIKLPASAGSSKKQEFQKNIYFCFIDYAKTFDFIFWAPKSLQMVIAAMKWKDAYSLEGKLWPT